MRRNLIALVSGTLFGLGLCVSQMINPAKVLAFLDVAGHWDPSLALVMGSALSVMALAWRWHRSHHPVALSAEIRLADLGHIDAPLVIGAVLFGVGWGLVGYCPGPALSALSLFSLKPVIFVASMLVGMGLFRVLEMRPSASGRETATDTCG